MKFSQSIAFALLIVLVCWMLLDWRFAAVLLLGIAIGGVLMITSIGSELSENDTEIRGEAGVE